MSKKARPEHIAAMRLLAARGRRPEPVVASVLRHRTETPATPVPEGHRTRVKIRDLSDEESDRAMFSLTNAYRRYPGAVGYLVREAALAGNITYRRAA